MFRKKIKRQKRKPEGERVEGERDDGEGDDSGEESDSDYIRCSVECVRCGVCEVWSVRCAV